MLGSIQPSPAAAINQDILSNFSKTQQEPSKETSNMSDAKKTALMAFLTKNRDPKTKVPKSTTEQSVSINPFSKNETFS